MSLVLLTGMCLIEQPGLVWAICTAMWVKSMSTHDACVKKQSHCCYRYQYHRVVCLYDTENACFDNACFLLLIHWWVLSLEESRTKLTQVTSLPYWSFYFLRLLKDVGTKLLFQLITLPENNSPFKPSDLENFILLKATRSHFTWYRRPSTITIYDQPLQQAKKEHSSQRNIWPKIGPGTCTLTHTSKAYLVSKSMNRDKIHNK